MAAVFTYWLPLAGEATVQGLGRLLAVLGPEETAMEKSERLALVVVRCGNFIGQALIGGSGRIEARFCGQELNGLVIEREGVESRVHSQPTRARRPWTRARRTSSTPGSASPASNMPVRLDDPEPCDGNEPRVIICVNAPMAETQRPRSERDSVGRWRCLRTRSCVAGDPGAGSRSCRGGTSWPLGVAAVGCSACARTWPRPDRGSADGACVIPRPLCGRR
jgi:hypothetical protein